MGTTDAYIRALEEATDPEERARAADELGRRRDPLAIPPLLRALEDDAAYLADSPGWDEPVRWSYRPSAPPERSVREAAVQALATHGESGRAAFVSHLESLPVSRRAELVRRAGSLAGRAYLGSLLRADTMLAKAAMEALAAPLRSAWGSISFDELLALFRQVDELEDPALEPEATRLREALARTLLDASRRRAEVASAWRASEIEPWLERRSAEGLRWELAAAWMCGPEEQALPRLAAALFAIPEAERWARASELLPRHITDLGAAARLDARLFAWLEERFEADARHLSNATAAPLVALAAVLGGSVAVGRHVLEHLASGRMDSRHSAEWLAAFTGHAEHTPGFRGELIAALIANLGAISSESWQAPQMSLRALSAGHAGEVALAIVRALGAEPRPRGAEVLATILSEMAPLDGSSAAAARALLDRIAPGDPIRASIERALRA